MISVILPTIRPEMYEASLNSIHEAADGVPHEVVVVADFTRMARENEQWIVAPRQGVINAIDIGYKAIKGDVVFLTNDETICGPSSIMLLYEMAKRRPDTLFCPRHYPPYPFYYYGKFFASFPCAAVSLIEKVGGFLDPIYRGFYADPDLSMRVYAAGVLIEQVDEAIIYHYNQNRPDHQQMKALYLAQDRATFRARWDHLGEFCDP